MQYLLLIYSNENDNSRRDEAAQAQLMKDYFAYNDALKAAGAFVAGDALQPTGTATTVRLRDGKRLTTDGPFAETAEQLGGYYLIEAKDLDEALGWAEKIPTAKTGSIEVRPLMTFD